ncbi:MAG: hypothetical protein R6X32_03010 [Chloroflexota bacterium]|jgi:hypothetical protein
MMRRFFLLFITLCLGSLAACTQTDTPGTPLSTLPPPTDMATSVATNVATTSGTAVPTLTATIPPPTATASATPLPPDVSLTSDDIFVYPVPTVYEGDRLTIQIIPTVPESIMPTAVSVHLLVNGEEAAVGTLNNRTLAGQPVGLFQWIITAEPGTYEIQVILDRDGQLISQPRTGSHNEASVTITVQDAAALSRREAEATWVQAESDCCIIHVASGTAAYRDLPRLIPRIETAVQTAADRLNEPPLRKIDVYLVDRVIGQGGYAGSAMVISYSDRGYNGGQLDQMLIHEATHVIDRQFAPRRISFLAEGVAVWASGGHYKSENIAERAAALPALGYYVPLAQLINNFYPVQHEIGYLQAAGFVEYLINQRGWGRFRTFYSSVTAEHSFTLADAVDLNLQIYYDTTLEAAEADWLAHLQNQQPSDEAIADLQISLRYYDTMRYYQLHYDPTAHFLTAWLPFPSEVREQGNPADLNRRPQSETNIVLEIMFVAADAALQAGDFNRANVLLDSITRVIDNGGAFLDPLAFSYLDIVRTIHDLGYVPQQVAIEGSRAVATVTPNGQTNLIQLNLLLRGRNWILTS